MRLPVMPPVKPMLAKAVKQMPLPAAVPARLAQLLEEDGALFSRYTVD